MLGLKMLDTLGLVRRAQVKLLSTLCSFQGLGSKVSDVRLPKVMEKGCFHCEMSPLAVLDFLLLSSPKP
jgi:hypothetical protein